MEEDILYGTGNFDNLTVLGIGVYYLSFGLSYPTAAIGVVPDDEVTMMNTCDIVTYYVSIQNVMVIYNTIEFLM